MTKLLQELQRLFCLPGQEGTSTELIRRALEGTEATGLPLLSQAHQVRTLVVGLNRIADWSAVAALFEGVQADWEWPAPAVSVSPAAGFQAWFSLLEPLPLEQAERILAAMRAQFLADVPAGHVTLLPSNEGSHAEVAMVPAYHEASDTWSAFIDPTMGSMFCDQTGLEVAPNPDRQADMLAAVHSVKPQDVQRVLALIGGEATSGKADAHAPLPPEAGQEPRTPAGRRDECLNIGSDFTDPRAFLLAVMNDERVAIRERIRAARALLSA